MKPGQFASTPLWWEIAYVGGQVVRGTTPDEWIDAPSEGVLVVRQPVERTYVKRGREVHFTIRVAGHDYYWLRPDGTIDGGNDVPEGIDPYTVKQGAWASREEFAVAYNAWLPDVER